MDRNNCRKMWISEDWEDLPEVEHPYEILLHYKDGFEEELDRVIVTALNESGDLIHC